MHKKRIPVPIVRTFWREYLRIFLLYIVVIEGERAEEKRSGTARELSATTGQP
jgi:hypothetical protein